MSRWLRWIGYPLFALVAFVICLYATFPYDRVKVAIEEHIAASGEALARIGDVGPSPLFGLTLSDFRLTILPPRRPEPLPGAFGVGDGSAQPQQPQKPQVLHFDELTVSAGLLALLGGGVDIDFSFKGLGGEAEGSYEAAPKKGWSAQVEAERIDLGRIPQIAAAVGLPVSGRLSARAELVLPLNQWSNASGTIELGCEQCTVGDGKAKLKVPNNPMLAMGITLPRIRLGRLGGQVTVDKGVATFENVSAKSPDIEVHLEGQLNLREPMAFSTMQGYLRFKISPELKRRDPKFELLENGLSNARRSDGFYGMLLTGMIKNMVTVPSRLGPSRSGQASVPGRGRTGLR